MKPSPYKYFLYRIDSIPGLEDFRSTHLVLQGMDVKVGKREILISKKPDTTIGFMNLYPAKNYLLEIEKIEEGVLKGKQKHYFFADSFEIIEDENHEKVRLSGKYVRV